MQLNGNLKIKYSTKTLIKLIWKIGVLDDKKFRTESYPTQFINKIVGS